MFIIQKVLKLGEKSSRVLLDDGRRVRVPNSVVTLGVIAEEDIRKVETHGVVDYIHVSFYKEPRVRTEPVLCRDMSKFDASKEIALLRGILMKNLFVLGRCPSEDEIDDLAEDCFLHFWERKLFQRYDESKLKYYYSYLSRAVRNYLIDLKRNSRYYHNTYHKSLNAPLKTGEEGDTLMDLLPSTCDLESEAIDSVLSSQFKGLLSKFEVVVLKLDSEETTGLNFTYHDLFKSLFVTRDYKSFVSLTGYSSTTVDTRKRFLLDMLYPTYKEMMYA